MDAQNAVSRPEISAPPGVMKEKSAPIMDGIEQIDQALRAFEGALGDLGDAISTHEGRINPVAHDAVPSETMHEPDGFITSGGSVVARELTDRANRTVQYVQQLRYQTLRLRELTDRLEL